ncbi:hypothetical protein BV25DRAFT_1803814 [Artomyces pyxidatus]|uniref:Uncharacterized protein n=1 Tax=Artomyces pyxidatus TaxID=48021 RepID=A0ACB8T1B7_9AGAM|nr:hypothetical protein BV25DRAFT_1803814 [Artomyces pyxidatus]
MSAVHRRKSSREEDADTLVISSNDATIATAKHPANGKEGADIPQARTRTISTPSQPPSSSASSSLSPPTSAYPKPPPSAGPYRTGFTNGVGLGHQPASSPLRASFSMPSHLHSNAHSRTRSVSGPFSPPLPSPLSMSFPSPSSPSSATSTSFPTSATAPEFPRSGRTHGRTTSHTQSPYPASGSEPPPSPSAGSAQSRRHSRLHSRNLSIFFPRPGSLPHTSIAEDGAQELEVDSAYEASTTLIPSASPNHQKLGEGFTFGARPPPDALPSSPSFSSASAGSRASRRGHHHKHSLSHNFFSFLEPGAQSELQTQPTLTPVSPWTPGSPLPASADPSSVSFPSVSPVSPYPRNSLSPSSSTSNGPFSFANESRGISKEAIIAAAGQFMLGAWLWVTGQQVGSLSCTGLGYWVVFDSFGVVVGHVLPAYLRRPSLQAPLRRPYGNSRMETVVLFAQAVYLMFSAVYVFKETVEHVLLSAGEGHHHHPGDESVEVLGIDFPLVILTITFFSFIVNAVAFGNHSNLVNVTGNQLPPLASFLNPSRFRYAQRYPEPDTHVARLLANPYSLAPITVSAVIFAVRLLAPPSAHRSFDLLLAAAEATAMFNLAYPSCTTIGTVLLQTSPQRGLASGRMEAFLRAMREIERHPQVLHLPPPHIWQLTPTEHSSKGGAAAQSLVVTLELRVASDLGDKDVLKLTRWAWERCVQALGLSVGEGSEGVTIGIVRG